MFGDSSFSPETILAGPELGGDDAQAIFGGPFEPWTGWTPSNAPFLVPYDQWGLTQIPTAANGQPFTPLAAIEGTSLWLAGTSPFPTDDTCIGVILDFLATWLVTDANVQIAWQAVAGASGEFAVRRVFAHDPKKAAFNVSNLPALYMWRGDPTATQEWDADDWLVEKSKVTGLWVFPSAAGEKNHQVRHPFAHVLAKLIGAGIERGRTPSWVQPGDTDRQATRIGSLFYTYAGFHQFFLESWRHGRLDLESKSVNGGTEIISYPAIEMTFTLWEKLDYGLGRFAPLGTTFDTISNGQGQPVVSGFLDH